MIIQEIRDRWALYLFGSLGLLVTTIIVGRATGEPLLTDLGWVLVVAAPHVSSLVAILKGVALGAFTIALLLLAVATLVPIRDWLEEELARRAKSKKKVARPHINDYLDRDKPAIAQAPNSHELQQRLHNHSILYLGVVRICDEYIGGNRPATIGGLLQELEQLVAGLASANVNARQSAPDAAISLEAGQEAAGGRELTYAAVAALLEAGNVGIKRGREIVRTNGGVVPRDYSGLQEILSMLPSPTARIGAENGNSQAVNVGERGIGEPRRAAQRSQPRHRKGRIV